MLNGHDVRTTSARPIWRDRGFGPQFELPRDDAHQSDPSHAVIDHSGNRAPMAVRTELTRRLESLRAGLNTLNREHFEADSEAFADTMSALHDEIEDMLQNSWLQSRS